MSGLRKCVSELMIYDATEELFSDQAEEFLEQHQYGGWTVDARGIRQVGELTTVLQDYISINQITFTSHAYSGGAQFGGEYLTTATLPLVTIAPGLFRGPGRLLFQGCQTARTEAGRRFLVAAGRHFFAGNGGVVGGCTVSTYGFASGSRLPLFDLLGIWETGSLVVFLLDTSGNVVATRTVRPFGL